MTDRQLRGGKRQRRTLRAHNAPAPILLYPHSGLEDSHHNISWHLQVPHQLSSSCFASKNPWEVRHGVIKEPQPALYAQEGAGEHHAAGMSPSGTAATSSQGHKARLLRTARRLHKSFVLIHVLYSP